MKLMTKGHKHEYVPDIFVESYLRDGYTLYGQELTVAAPVSAAPAVEDAAESTIDEVNEAETVETAAPAAPAVEETASAGTDKHVCPFCGKDYSRKANLDKHIAKMHS